MSAGEDGYDLTGHWAGVFSFPYELPPGPFEAQIRDTSGAISGVTTEPGDMYDPPGTVLDAVIEGHRNGAALTFVKTYGEELRPDQVHYRGRIQPGGDEVQGEWTIPGHWSGTFLMIRAGSQEAGVSRKASVTA